MQFGTLAVAHPPAGTRFSEDSFDSQRGGHRDSRHAAMHMNEQTWYTLGDARHDLEVGF